MGSLLKVQSLFPLSRSDLVSYGFVFSAYYLSAELGFYLYSTFETSPAAIWPPVGIALVSVIYGGYRMAIPIFLAQAAAFTMQPSGLSLINTIISIGYTVQAIAALYIMRRLHFVPQLYKLRNTLILAFVAFVVTAVEPTIATLARMILGEVSVSPLVSIGRAWGAGIFSALVITPFALTWYPWPTLPYTKREVIEVMAAFVLLLVTVYFLFWTPYPRFFGIAVIFLLPAVLIWFALRLQTRWMTLAVMLTSVIGLAGSIVTHSGDDPLNAELLAAQIYIGMVAAIFLVFVAVVEERRAAYERLSHAFESTTASDAAKTQFIAILAHELRNPLAPIISSLELLGSQAKDEEVVETIEVAQAHTVIIRRLLDDLLDTARLSQGKLRLQKENVRLREIINHSLASVNEIFRARHHTVSVSLPPEDISLHADPVRLKQVFINLLNNAGKYTDPGGAITITATIEGSRLLIHIIDNGIGIEPELLPYVFEPFRQAEAAVYRSKGLGIGLFLTKSLIEMHGGTVTAHSSGAGMGTEMRICLPLPEPVVPQQAKASPEELQSNILPTSKSRILIVDDNEAAADGLAKLMNLHGHITHACYSGTEALAMVSKFTPTLILLDIGMPEMDGFEVARRLRTMGFTGAIVALSGYGQESDREESRRAGFDRHLVKPVGADDINQLLAELSK